MDKSKILAWETEKKKKELPLTEMGMAQDRTNLRKEWDQKLSFFGYIPTGILNRYLSKGVK